MKYELGAEGGVHDKDINWISYDLRALHYILPLFRSTSQGKNQTYLTFQFTLLFKNTCSIMEFNGGALSDRNLRLGTFIIIVSTSTMNNCKLATIYYLKLSYLGYSCVMCNP